MKQIVATVVAKGKPISGLYRPHGNSIKFSQTIRLNCPEIAQEAKPGQFVMVKCGKDCTLPRPFSIHRVIDNEDIMLYVAVLEDGKGTAWLSQRQTGDTVELFGPLGNGFIMQREAKNILMIAGGIGVAPLRFLYDEAVERKCTIKLLVGVKTAEQSDIEHLFHEGTDIIFISEETLMGTGKTGKVTRFIPGYADWIDQVFACGPLGMYQTMARMPELRNKPVQISLEVRMGCGRGLCYGCTVKTKNGLKQVCTDGPVFNLEDILWDELDILKGV